MHDRRTVLSVKIVLLFGGSLSFASRLQQLVDTRSGGNAAEFSRLCGVQDTSIRQYLRGTKPSLDNLIAIAAATSVSMDWLATGSEQKSSSDSVRGDVIEVPRLMVSASAGFGAYSTGATAPTSIPMPKAILDRANAKPEYVRVLTATGISMEPTIGDGDLLLVDTAPARRTQVSDGRIYVLSVDDGLFVKRLRQTATGWMMSSDNRALFPDEPIPSSASIKIHGQVVWTGRQLP